jgi:hypothetical protein
MRENEKADLLYICLLQTHMVRYLTDYSNSIHARTLSDCEEFTRMKASSLDQLGNNTPHEPANHGQVCSDLWRSTEFRPQPF